MSAATIGKNRRQNGSESKKALCPVCGTEYVQYRRWQTFCSPKCRKASWERERKVHPNYDIRAKIDQIVADLGLIKAALNIKGGI